MVARKLKEVDQVLDSTTTRDDLAQFLDATWNVRKLNDLVGDIRDALMGYQVYILPNRSLLSYLTMPQISLQQDIYDKSCRTLVSLVSSLLNAV